MKAVFCLDEALCDVTDRERHSGFGGGAEFDGVGRITGVSSISILRVHAVTPAWVVHAVRCG